MKVESRYIYSKKSCDGTGENPVMEHMCRDCLIIVRVAPVQRDWL
jgi:hypothetical protein